MANTVSLLSYANTFGDWVVTTNALVKENNDLAANNYVKPKGTLYLNDTTLGLQVANNSIFAGQLQVQGIGSSAYIQNNLRVDTQVYFQNTILGLTNSGELISKGKITANGSNIGLNVANSVTIGGYLRVTSNTNLANTLAVTGATTLSNTLAVTGATTLSNTLAVTGAATMSSTLAVTGAATMSSTLYVASNIVGSDNLTITNLSNTGTLIVRSDGSVAGALSVAGSSYQNNITANATIYTPILNATNYATVNGLTSNTITRTTTLNVSGTEYVDTIVANTSINACNATLTANSITVGTGGLSVLGNFTINGTTVYNTPIFTLSANTPNQTSYFGVYRSPGANAYIKWDQANTYWSIADVSANSYYYRILTTKELS